MHTFIYIINNIKYVKQHFGDRKQQTNCDHPYRFCIKNVSVKYKMCEKGILGNNSNNIGTNN